LLGFDREKQADRNYRLTDVHGHTVSHFVLAFPPALGIPLPPV
jgi:hypothetical protein